VFSKRVRDASEEMRNATSDLRRQDAKEAAAAGNRALERLREAQRDLEAAKPDERRRAVGDLQLEARQLADAQRQAASELARTAPGDASRDTVRRLAGDEERLASRARKLADALRQVGSASRDPRARPGGQDAEKADARAQAAASEAAKEMERQKLADRMQQSADALGQATSDPRGRRGSTAPSDPMEQARGQVGAQQDLARAFEKLADGLAAGTGSQDAESKKLSDQLARTQALRDQLEATGRDLESMKNGQNGGRGQAAGGNDSGGSGRSPGSSGKPGQGSQGGAGSGSDLTRMREEYARQLQETKDLVDQMRRDDPSFARGGGAGFTFEEATRTSVTAPGTEAFKQDFAKWEALRRQATQALENIQASLSKKLQAKQSKDRLAAGTDDKAPPQYKDQVDSYFKAIASKKKQ
jgi:hypothetical protein